MFLCRGGWGLGIGGKPIYLSKLVILCSTHDVSIQRVIGVWWGQVSVDNTKYCQIIRFISRSCYINPVAEIMFYSAVAMYVPITCNV